MQRFQVVIAVEAENIAVASVKGNRAAKAIEGEIAAVVRMQPKQQPAMLSTPVKDEVSGGTSWLDTKLRFSLGRDGARFGHTDFGDYTWRDITEGPHGGGRHTFMTWLRYHPEVYDYNPSIRGRVEHCIARIERRPAVTGMMVA
jgi:hypothetical protein